MAMRLASAYPVTTQPTVAREPPSSFWIWGTATLTMLPSTACNIVPSKTPLRFKKLIDYLIPVSLAAGLGACSGARPVPDAQPNKAAEKPAAVAEAPAPAPAPDSNAQGQADLERAMESLRNVSVFFEFDSSTLTSEAKDKLSAVGTILAKHPDLNVPVAGNCD